MTYKQISACRICGKHDLNVVLDLGYQTLTGVFPRSTEQKITRGPLRLVKCVADDGCGLLQLAHSYVLSEMYGENYGYRSGLNASMVNHLKAKVERISRITDLSKAEVVLDIGSNDGTTLGFYPSDLIRIGMDPTSTKFHQYYAPGISAIADYFSREKFLDSSGGKKASVVTSFSMFYDLEDPLAFTKEVASILSDDGIWIFEQSYLPSMITTRSFDTVCHEHLEYYSLKQIVWLTQRARLKVVDVEFNDVNGGSFSITVAKESSERQVYADLQHFLSLENPYNELSVFADFEKQAIDARDALLRFVQQCKAKGLRVGGLGASTKGNVLLQYCGFSSSDIWAIGEVNPDKYDSFTPGTLIPILAEAEVIENSDYLIVLPWHFRSFFEKKMPHLSHKLVYPLPKLDVPAK